MNIGKAAALSGLPAKTVRYYDDIGLVTAHREANGYRYYDDALLQQLRFLHRARMLGFSLDDCRSLLSLYQNPQRASADVKKLAEARIAEVEQKIHELHQLKASLQAMTQACHGDSLPDCPIIDTLAADV